MTGEYSDALERARAYYFTIDVAYRYAPAIMLSFTPFHIAHAHIQGHVPAADPGIFSPEILLKGRAGRPRDVNFTAIPARTPRLHHGPRSLSF